jgi:hypothetical protein
LKQFLTIIVMITILLCSCKDKSNLPINQKPKEKEQSKVEIKTPTDKNDPEYYKHIFGLYLWEPENSGLSIKIDANKMYLRWDYEKFETIDGHKERTRPRTSWEIDEIREKLDNPDPVAPHIAKAVLDEVVTALSILKYAELPESLSVNLEQYEVVVKSDNFGNKKSKEVVRFKAYYDNKTVAKIFSAWKDNREVKIKNVAKSWYWTLKEDL